MKKSIHTKTALLEAKCLIVEMLKNDKPAIEHSFDVLNLTSVFYAELPVHIRINLNKERLLCAALLHDVGKSSIADEILNKPGELNAYEKDIIKKHTENGKKILEKANFKNVADWVCYHHERVDGTGYLGLTREQIPLESKIIAIADTYSALTSDRVYRKHCGVISALEVLDDIADTQLDGNLVSIFRTAIVKKISRYA